MKTLLIAFLFFSEGQCTTATTVYVCDSANAVRYHYKEDCRGLSNCNYRILKTTLEKAEKDNKTLCKWERDR